MTDNAGVGVDSSMSYNPDDYPDGHSPFCWSTCDHPCHDAYDNYLSERYDAIDGEPTNGRSDR